jgi:SpoVK/Ycf46/Vps4 family AAA+-type ATPase
LDEVGRSCLKGDCSAPRKALATGSHLLTVGHSFVTKEEKNNDVLRLFDKAAENTPALVILEDLDRAFPTAGKRTKERTVSVQTWLNCLDGVGAQEG